MKIAPSRIKTEEEPGDDAITLLNLLAVQVGTMSVELVLLRERRERLFEAIAYGDDKHRAWLKQAIDDHFEGKLVQRPR